MKKKQMCGYLVSVPIPLDEHGSPLPDLFRQAIEKLLCEGCDGIYLFGTSGEGYAFTDEEFTRLVDIFADVTAHFEGFRQIGCFGLSSDQVKRRCRIAVERGLSGVQITLPFWKELSDRELFQYVTDVCGTLPEVSFLLYNNPRNKRRLTGKELEALHREAPNLQGAKTGSGNWLGFFELITESPSLQHFVTEAAFPFCHRLGAAGLIPSSNYALPDRARAFYDAVVAGDLSAAARFHQNTMRFFHQTAVPLIQKGYIDGAIDKAYAKIGGMNIPLHMKSPYRRLSDKDFVWLKSVIEAEFYSNSLSNK